MRRHVLEFHGEQGNTDLNASRVQARAAQLGPRSVHLKPE